MSKKPPQKGNEDEFVFEGFEPANTTPVPDILFDRLLAKLTSSELRVLLYIIRRTWGFKKDTDAISLNQFQYGITTKDGKVLDEGCGIKDRKTIIATLSSLEKKGYIQREKSKTESGDDATTIYRIHFKGVVGKSNHPESRGSGKIQPPVVGKSTLPRSGKIQPPVVGKSNPQETVIQQTELQETVIQESITPNGSTTQPLVADATPTPSFSSQSCLSSQETKPKEKAPSKKKTEEPKGPPEMPPLDAPWSREIAVQIVEAKKGRIYSPLTRKQELEEAGKVLQMTIDGTSITREQFESAWDDLASSSWWDEHGKPCMIKYLRRDDTIVGIIKKLKRQKRPLPSQPSEAKPRPSFIVSEEKKQKNIEKLRALAAAKSTKE
jgi:uncharacterized membrane protein